MLEVIFNNITKEIRGWCGDARQFGNQEKEGYTVVILDTPIPDEPPDALLCDGQKLISNPAYVEPEPPRDLLAEIDELKARLDKITKVKE